MAKPPLATFEKTCDDGQIATRWLCAVCGEWHDDCPKKDPLKEERAGVLKKENKEMVTKQTPLIVYLCPTTGKIALPTSIKQERHVDAGNFAWWHCPICRGCHVLILLEEEAESEYPSLIPPAKQNGNGVTGG